jgi:outer membrane immunogenic protein
MMKFRLGLVLAAGVAMQFGAASVPAVAADLPGSYKDTPYVVMPWQGLYFGGHGGGAWGAANTHDHFDYYGDPDMYSNAKSTDLIGGVQAGYNVQQGHLVFGVEGDIGYLGLSASGADKYCRHANCSWDIHNIDGKYDTSGGLYGDLTGRIGYATNRVLFYGKGGVAFLNADLKTHYNGTSVTSAATPDGISPFDFDHSETLMGWTIGAGAEVALSPSWSVKAEYQHFDFGTMSHSYQDCHDVVNSCPANGQYSAGSGYAVLTGKTDTAITVDAVKLGVNYHVGN